MQSERLRTLEALLDAGTIQHLERRGVRRGWRCLEVGAGGGSIAAWLAARVAPEGSVVATDLDTTVLEALAHPGSRCGRTTCWWTSCPRRSSISSTCGCCWPGWRTASSVCDG